MTIAGWPYPITVSGDFVRGLAALITVDCSEPLSDERYAKVQYAVESFVALAAAGGLGGDRVAPFHSTAVLSDQPPPAGGTRATWNLTALAIDPRGLVVLFNMLALLVDGLSGVTVQAEGTGPHAPITQEDLPPSWPQVPFSEDDDRTGPFVELNVEFARQLSDADVELVLEGLQTWLDCGSVQGYRDWTTNAEASFLAPTADPPFKVSGSEISAELEDSGVLEGCYDILTNVLIKAHTRVPVATLELV